MFPTSSMYVDYRELEIWRGNREISRDSNLRNHRRPNSPIFYIDTRRTRDTFHCVVPEDSKNSTKGRCRYATRFSRLSQSRLTQQCRIPPGRRSPTEQGARLRRVKTPGHPDSYLLQGCIERKREETTPNSPNSPWSWTALREKGAMLSLSQCFECCMWREQGGSWHTWSLALRW